MKRYWTSSTWKDIEKLCCIWWCAACIPFAYGGNYATWKTFSPSTISTMAIIWKLGLMLLTTWPNGRESMTMSKMKVRTKSFLITFLHCMCRWRHIGSPVNSCYRIGVLVRWINIKIDFNLIGWIIPFGSTVDYCCLGLMPLLYTKLLRLLYWEISVSWSTFMYITQVVWLIVSPIRSENRSASNVVDWIAIPSNR